MIAINVPFCIVFIYFLFFGGSYNSKTLINDSKPIIIDCENHRSQPHITRNNKVKGQGHEIKDKRP